MSYTLDYMHQTSIYALGWHLKIQDEGTALNPITFKDIADYCKANPVPPIRMPYNRGVDPNFELTDDNLSEWNFTGDIGSVALETTNKIQGNNAIKYTKNGTGAFQLNWNVDGSYRNNFYPDGITPISSTYNYYFTVGQMKELVINVYTDATDLILTKIHTLDLYGVNYPLYGGSHENGGAGWNIPNGVWTEIRVNLEDFDDKSTSRHWWQKFGQLFLEFTGGASGNVVILDDVYFYNEEINMRQLTATAYVNGLSYLLYDNVYFKDTNFQLFNDVMAAAISVLNSPLFNLTSDTLGHYNQIYVNGLKNSGGSGFYIMPYITLAGRDIQVKNLQASGRSANGRSIALQIPLTVYSSDPSTIIEFENIIISFGGFDLYNVIVDQLIKLTDITSSPVEYPARIYDPDANIVLTNFKVKHNPYSGYDYFWLEGASLYSPIIEGYTSRFLFVRNYRDYTYDTHYGYLYNPKFIDCTPETLIVDLHHYNDGVHVAYPTGFYMYYTMNLEVEDKNDTKIQGAAITILNKFGEVIATGQTDIDGKWADDLLFNSDIFTQDDYTGDYSWKYIYVFSTDDNINGNPQAPYTIKIEKNGYQAYTEIVKEITEEIFKTIALQPYTYIDRDIKGVPEVENNVNGSVEVIKLTN